MGDQIGQEDNFSLFGGFRLVSRDEGHALFRNLPGWKFDEGLWQSPDLLNSFFTLPLASDLDFAQIPETYFKTGIGSKNAIELDEINFLDEGFVLGWTPGVIRGDYWVFRSPDYLHSSESILAIPANDITFTYIPDTDPGTPDEDSIRSHIDLDFEPSLISPVTVKRLTRDRNLAIKQSASFTQVSKFTGIATNGIEQDGDDYNNTDKTKLEFKLIKNDSDPHWNEPILLNENSAIQGSILRIRIDDDPVKSWGVRFSRKDIFVRELPFSLWHEKFADPDQDLEYGDYAVGYQGSSGAGGGIWLWKGGATLPDNLGTFSYKPNKPLRLQFNQDVRVSHPFVEITDSIVGIDGEVFFLPYFPVLDVSSFESEDSVGELVLDVDSTQVYVGVTRWTRVQSLEDVAAGDNQQVYELNPLWGTIRFGNGGNVVGDADPIYGDRPDEPVTVTWTSVPYIRYDKKDSSHVFSDPTEDLDPMTNALKQGFLVLDNRRLTPWRIELTTNSPSERNSLGTLYHGKLVDNTLEGLGVPPTSEADITTLRARVLAYGSPPQGIPNVPVEFVCPDGLLAFTQSAAVTDGDGYAYTEAFGKSNFNEFVLKVHLFNSTEDPILNPTANDLTAAFTPLDPIITDRTPEAIAVWSGAGADWTNNALIVTEQVDDAVEDIYLFVVSTPGANTLEDYNDDPRAPEDYLTPYNSTTRDGGLAKVWAYDSDGAYEIVRPIEVVQISNKQAILVFDRELPSGQLVMGYRVVIDRTSTVHAKTVESPILLSNELNFYLSLNETMKGQWKLPNLQGIDADGFHEEDPDEENIDSSRIGTATYISPNDYSVTEFRNEADEIIEEGVSAMTLIIVGTGFTSIPNGPSVYIIKVNEDGTISSLKDITSASAVISADRIQIDSLPAPPTGNPGDYYIAVSSFSEHTSKLFTYIG
jgi:hypothetical protein